MTNATDRKVAEILGWKYVSYKSGGMTTGQTPWWKSPEGRAGRSKHYRLPAYTTDITLIGEMLKWLSKQGQFWEISDDCVIRYGTRERDIPRDTFRQGETINAALCLAIIAVGGE